MAGYLRQCPHFNTLYASYAQSKQEGGGGGGGGGGGVHHHLHFIETLNLVFSLNKSVITLTYSVLCIMLNHGMKIEALEMV